MTLLPAYGSAAVPLLNYSTTEQATGRLWIDGKTIYTKTVDTGLLPNATSKTVAHGITGLAVLIRITAMGAVTPNTLPIPMATVSVDPAVDQIQIFVSNTNIELDTGATNRSDHASFVVLEYTKT